MKHPLTKEALEDLRFDERGLVPVIAQDEPTGAVLMLAWANREALEQSLATGRMTYWSRSRGRLWTKGEESGHTQKLVALAADCDQDAVLAVVEQAGPACHEKTGTCWTHRDEAPVATELGNLDRLALDRRLAPAGGYTDSLLADADLAAAKVVEEASEVAAVLRGQDNDDSLEHEAADLLYHLIVALRGAETSLEAVLRELRARHG
ncbi:MAG: bifunctional phosphoribosyl-AMP cyclohydrolase/phosphoribosyl-ATP diphosphatase HisIE [Thermoplasmatota archaeon]